MPYTTAIGRYTLAPVWSRPRGRAPLQSQVLLGEPIQLVERHGDFWSVRYDGGREEGYMAADQVLAVDRRMYEEQSERPAFTLDLFGMLLSDSFGVPVTFGARLPGYDGLQLRHDNRRFLYSGQAVLSSDLTQDAALLIRLGRKWLHVPELAGGRSPTGVGNADLVQLLLSLVGVPLPRAVRPMAAAGETVDFVEQCQTGDVAFFDDGRGGLSHVGLLLPSSQVLHVSGRVRVDAVDHFGIFNLEERRYSHRLRIVKRYLPATAATENIRIEDRYADKADDGRQILIF